MVTRRIEKIIKIVFLGLLLFTQISFAAIFIDRIQELTERGKQLDLQIERAEKELAELKRSKSKPTQQDLINASVQILVDDSKGRTFGSGTVLKCERNDNDDKFTCYVLTVAHVFSDYNKSSKLKVANLTGGKVLLVNKDADLALVSVQSSRPLTTAHLAPRNWKPVVGERVIQIGYPQGKPVSILTGKRSHTIIAVNRYLGSGTIECSLQPIEGRSGGGLFLERTGEQIGVCSAREPSEKIGIYASLEEIYKMLVGTKYEFLLK